MTTPIARIQTPLALALGALAAQWGARRILAISACSRAVRTSLRPAESLHDAIVAAGMARDEIEDAIAYYVAHGDRPVVTVRTPVDTSLGRACDAARREAAADVERVVLAHGWQPGEPEPQSGKGAGRGDEQVSDLRVLSLIRSSGALDDAPKAYAIEFRSGSYFTSLDADHGGTRDQAHRFATREEADAFGNEHEWIWFNGGMVVEVPPASAPPIAAAHASLLASEMAVVTGDEPDPDSAPYALSALASEAVEALVVVPCAPAADGGIPVEAWRGGGPTVRADVAPCGHASHGVCSE